MTTNPGNTGSAQRRSHASVSATGLVYQTVQKIRTGCFEEECFSQLKDLLPRLERESDSTINTAIKEAISNEVVDAIPVICRNSTSYRLRASAAVKIIMSQYPDSLISFLDMRYQSASKEIRFFLAEGDNHFAVDDILEPLGRQGAETNFPQFVNLGRAVLSALPDGFFKDIELLDEYMITLYSVIGERLRKENPKNNLIKRLCVECDMGL